LTAASYAPNSIRPHYLTASEQQTIEQHAPAYLRNMIRILTETGLRVYKELASMRKDQVDLANKTIFISDSKTSVNTQNRPGMIT
jgi:integrase